MKHTFTILLVSLLALMLAFTSARVQPQYLQTQNRMGQPDFAGEFAGTLQNELVALLGITPDELVALHREGKTLDDILVELKVDIPSFTTQLVQKRNELINQGVSQGQLSAARVRSVYDPLSASVS